MVFAAGNEGFSNRNTQSSEGTESGGRVCSAGVGILKMQLWARGLAGTGTNRGRRIYGSVPTCPDCFHRSCISVLLSPLDAGPSPVTANWHPRSRFSAIIAKTTLDLCSQSFPSFHALGTRTEGGRHVSSRGIVETTEPVCLAPKWNNSSDLGPRNGSGKRYDGRLRQEWMEVKITSLAGGAVTNSLTPVALDTSHRLANRVRCRWS